MLIDICNLILFVALFAIYLSHIVWHPWNVQGCLLIEQATLNQLIKWHSTLQIFKIALDVFAKGWVL